MRWLDSMVNFVSQMGAPGKSKSAADAFFARELEVNEISAIYRGDWVGRKIIDMPVADMLREWRRWQASPDLITTMEEAERKHEVACKVEAAACMARLYGGAAIIIGADVARPEEPLTPRRLGRNGLQYLTVVSRHALTTPEIEYDIRSPMFGKPKYYEINSTAGASARLHPSRVIPFFGPPRRDHLLNVPDPWGDSFLLAVYDAIHNRALAETAIAELLHEAKVDVIQIPNLGSKLGSDQDTSLLVKRFTAANTIKSINNMLLLDKDEVWERKQTTFTGLPEILDRYLQIVSAAADIPATRLLGTTAKGLNNSGAGDLTNYYDGLAGLRKKLIHDQLLYLDMVLWVDATGSIPSEVYAEWLPMWQLSAKEKADIAKTRAETTNIYAQLGLVEEEGLRIGVENQLIEDGVYPGLEAALATVRSSANGEGQAADPQEGDNSSPDRAVGNGRNLITRRA